MRTRAGPDDEPTGDDASQRREVACPGRFAPAGVVSWAPSGYPCAAPPGPWPPVPAASTDGRRGCAWCCSRSAGAALGVALFGRVPAKVGPFQTTMAIRPSLNGHTVVHLAPLGTIDLDTHDWPVALDLRVDEIAVADAERIAENPALIDRLGDDAADEVRSALVGLAVRALLAGLVGGVVGALVARLAWTSALGGAAVGALLVAALGVGSWATFREEAVAEPRYTGLLTRAPGGGRRHRRRARPLRRVPRAALRPRRQRGHALPRGRGAARCSRPTAG